MLLSKTEQLLNSSERHEHMNFCLSKLRPAEHEHMSSCISKLNHNLYAKSTIDLWRAKANVSTTKRTLSLFRRRLFFFRLRRQQRRRVDGEDDAGLHDDQSLLKTQERASTAPRLHMQCLASVVIDSELIILQSSENLEVSRQPPATNLQPPNRLPPPLRRT